MNGSKVSSPSSAVVGNSIHLKVIPGSNEPLPNVTTSPEGVAGISHLDARKIANFTTFRLEAVATGKAVLQASGGTPNRILAGPIEIVIEDRTTLPATATNAGLFARLFLAEIPSPDQMVYTVEEARTAMSWMRVVLENRLAKPSVLWASAGAKTMLDVVKAKNQFEGFSNYPNVAKRYHPQHR